MVSRLRLRNILRNVTVLNVVLLAVIIALAAYLLPPFLNIPVAYTPPAPKQVPQEKQEQAVAAQPPSPLEYAVVSEQNVFNPERKIPTEKADQKALPKPDFVLYGTLITGDVSMAFMEDLKAPYSTAGRGKRQRTLRLGSALSGFTLTQVFTDRVVLVRGDEMMEVRMMDSHKKARGTEPAVAGAQASVPQTTFVRPPPAQAPLRSRTQAVGGLPPGTMPGMITQPAGAAPQAQEKK